MKKLIISLFAAGLLVANPAKGAQVYTPPPTGGLSNTGSAAAEGPTVSLSGNTLYVRGGTTRPHLELRSEKAISELDIADISGVKGELATVELARLDTLVDPLLGESFSSLSFNPPANASPRKQLLAIAWLFAIGLIGMATVGRRKKL